MGVGGQHYAPAALPPGKTRYPLYRRLGGPQGRSGRVRKISSPPGFDPRTVQPVVSRYTDWAIPAQCVCVCLYMHIYMYISVVGVRVAVRDIKRFCDAMEKQQRVLFALLSSYRIFGTAFINYKCLILSACGCVPALVMWQANCIFPHRILLSSVAWLNLPCFPIVS